MCFCLMLKCFFQHQDCLCEESKGNKHHTILHIFTMLNVAIGAS